MEKKRNSSKGDEKNKEGRSGHYSSVERASPRKHKVRIHLLDNEFKTIYLDFGAKVQDALDILSGKMHITDIDNFGIFEEWANNGKVEDRLLNPESIISEPKARKVEKKLILKCKLFRELNIINANEFCTHLYYIQTKTNILSGYYYAGLSNATALASLQMQIEFGAYCPEKHKLGFMQSRIRDFVSNQLLEKYGGKHMEMLILDSYAQSSCVIFI
jgi:hypothetical protein